MTEVLVGPGGTNLICNAIAAYINPGAGEEVIVFEPAWPCYIDMIQYAGGVYRPVELRQNGNKFEFDIELFKNSINSKTRIFILNNA
jgi:methionine aminotransferase